MNIKKHRANFTEPYRLRGYGKNFQGCIGIMKEYAAMLYVRLCVRFWSGIDIPLPPGGLLLEYIMHIWQGYLYRAIILRRKAYSTSTSQITH